MSSDDTRRMYEHLFMSLVNEWFFPTNPYWRYDTIELTTTVPPQGAVTVFDRRGTYWIFFIASQTDNLDIILRTQVYVGGVMDFSITPRMIKNWGVVMPIHMGPYVMLFEETPPNAVLLLTPSRWIPVRGRTVISIQNPTTSPANILFRIFILEITSSPATI
jgi:hypothetical protein